ncbi:LuxR C-terminal-related transcriptional regulator [Astrobacterium formosum]|uniref:LuxR C-terminal-related transcriptional regulator n=1 Tax=Astrobacterium formosum TaxID=3069710 RepID=UPI003F508EC8
MRDRAHHRGVRGRRRRLYHQADRSRRVAGATARPSCQRTHGARLRPAARFVIGEILTLSPRTVNKHFEQIFAKLGVENRTAASAIAMQTLSNA